MSIMNNVTHKKGKWSDEELEDEKVLLKDKIVEKEKELRRLNKQLELYEDALIVYTI